jgi:lon-related putative ATP-dependent protease
MSASKLTAQELGARCDPAGLDLSAPVDEALGPIVAQERAFGAVAYGIAIDRPGHHLFVMGPGGAGKRTLVRHAIAAHVARHGVTRSDWVYVNNFDHAHQPIALELPAGRGTELRGHVRSLVDELRTTIPATFESEAYATAVERLNTEHKERAEQAMAQVNDEARRRGLAMVRTPVGLSIVPRKSDDDVLTSEEFEALPAAEREKLQQAMTEVQEQLVRAMRASVQLRKERADRLRALNRSMTQVAVEHAVDEAKSHYADLPRVCAYLDALRADVIDTADRVPVRDEEPAESEREGGTTWDLSGYEVNVLVDTQGSDGTVIVEADRPSHQNLVGRVDHIVRFGNLLTDYRLIKPGALHRANGGYLLIDAAKLLTQPFAWETLKRALMRNEIRVESIAELVSIVSTVQLEPAPIPLKVKVVLFGERDVCYLMQMVDPEFDKLFRVVADLADDLPREGDTQRALARTLAAHAQREALLAPSSSALARLVDHAARLAGDATKMTAQVRRLQDVLVEADHLVRSAQRAAIDGEHIAAAVAARRARASRIHERLHEDVARNLLMIATDGERVGQVNGLMVYEVGDEAFGEPVRISATARLGEGEVIDVQRETHLGGPVHAKGVMILSSFLATRYSRFQAHAVHASLVFEQTYSYIEGDSASLAELAALLSAVADVPIRQCLAVTGSVNQFGEVQAIGGVNEKVEGFFDICAARALDGSHGVIVPQSNVGQLMLRDDVVKAVADGRFALFAVRSVDEAMEVLTGMPAGDPSVAAGNTVNGRIAMRLREYATLGRGERRFPRRRVGRPPGRLVDEEDEE